MDDSQRQTILTGPSMSMVRLTTVRASAEIMERAKTKDRPDADYGTVTKVEITFSKDDPAFADGVELQVYVGEVHGQLEEACQAEIRRRRFMTSMQSNPGEPPF
jgi:hypothetical protein